MSGAAEETLTRYKRTPILNEDERLFLVRSVRYVKEAFISADDGGEIMFNFMEDFLRIKPDLLIVNEDGDHPDKRKLCDKHGVEYVVLKRKPAKGLPKRSTTSLVKEIQQRSHD